MGVHCLNSRNDQQKNIFEDLEAESEKKFSRSSKVVTVQNPIIKPAHIQSVPKERGERGGKRIHKSTFIKKKPNKNK